METRRELKRKQSNTDTPNQNFNPARIILMALMVVLFSATCADRSRDFVIEPDISNRDKGDQKQNTDTQNTDTQNTVTPGTTTGEGDKVDKSGPDSTTAAEKLLAMRISELKTFRNELADLDEEAIKAELESKKAERTAILGLDDKLIELEEKLPPASDKLTYYDMQRSAYAKVKASCEDVFLKDVRCYPYGEELGQYFTEQTLQIQIDKWEASWSAQHKIVEDLHAEITAVTEGLATGDEDAARISEEIEALNKLLLRRKDLAAKQEQLVKELTEAGVDTNTL